MVNIEKYKDIIKELQPQNVQLIAVSKFKPKEDIVTLYNEGHRDFGENYVQELVEKAESLSKDIRWHFIGHLQTNKVKLLLPYVSMIHSIDSFKLLKEVNKHAQILGKIIPVCIQVYVGNEDTKYGLDEKELIELLEYYQAQKNDLSNIKVQGLMGMASLTSDESVVESEFKKMNDLFWIVKNQYFLGEKEFCQLSMGMSMDYQLAIQHGSTMVRIGSTIFGQR